MKKLFCIMVCFFLVLSNTMVASALSNQQEEMLLSEPTEQITFKAQKIIDDEILFQRAIMGVNDCPVEVSNAIKVEISGNMHTDKMEVFTTTQKIQERYTINGQSIGTYAITGYVVYSDTISSAKWQMCMEGLVQMKLTATYDYFTNASGQVYTSPRTMTYTYVAKEKSLESVLDMRLSYSTGTIAYDSNADRVSSSARTTDSTSNPNPSPGNSLSLSYRYGGVRFFKKGENTTSGSHTWSGGGYGSNQNRNSIGLTF